MFNKEDMMENGSFLYIAKSAKEVPITIGRLEDYIMFISSYVDKYNKSIKKYEVDKKDATHLIYERDYALYILGLGEKPEPYWKESVINIK